MNLISLTQVATWTGVVGVVLPEQTRRCATIGVRVKAARGVHHGGVYVPDKGLRERLSVRRWGSGVRGRPSWWGSGVWPTDCLKVCRGTETEFV